MVQVESGGSCLRTSVSGCLLAVSMFVSAVAAATPDVVNPLKGGEAADPFVVYDGASGYYYHLSTDELAPDGFSCSRIVVRRSRHAATLREGEEKVVYSLTPSHRTFNYLWAPEMHRASDGRWYIWTSAAVDKSLKNKRIFVLQSKTADPFDGFTFKGFPDPEQNAIDPSVTTFPDGRQYACISPYDAGKREQWLQIRELKNPWTYGERRADIAFAELPWELVPPYDRNRIVEGGFFLRSPDGSRLFIIYSANGCWSDDYALGVLEYQGGDPCRREAWKKSPQPLFRKGNGVYGTGHASFFRSPDGSETWCAYHSLKESNPRAKPMKRYMNLQKISFTADGYPVMGDPVKHGEPRPAPSGEDRPAPFDLFPGETTLPILAWCSIDPKFASTERFEELKEAGFNLSFTVGLHKDSDAIRVLDFAATVGMKCIFMSKSLRTSPETIVPRVRNHPALAGYDIFDEPNDDKLPELAENCRRIRALDKEHFCYLNLLPDYGIERKGIPYDKHVRKAAELIPTELISYDQYGIFVNRETGAFNLRQTYYRNLEIFSAEARKLQKPFWAFALATAHGSYPIPDTAQLRFQMYNNLAYGAQGLQYFTYWNGGTNRWNFHEAPINIGRRRSVVYERVRELNAEIQRRAFVFKGATVLWTRHTGESLPKGTTRLGQLPSFVETLDTKGRDAVVSMLVNGSRRYLVIVNGSYHQPLDMTLRFRDGVRRIRRDGTDADALAYDEKYRLEPGDCEIFEAVEPEPLWRRKGILRELEWNGSMSDPEPAEKDDRFLPPGIAEEPRPDAKIVYQDGLPKILLNGEALDPIINQSDMNYKFSLNQGRKLQSMGLTLNQIIFRKTNFEVKPGVYDFGRMDVYVRRMLKYVPEARILATIELEFPKWTMAHPEEQIGYADGPTDGFDVDDHRKRAARPSSASRAYREEVRRFFAELGKYVARQPWGNRIVAVRPSWGIYKEWHVYGMYHGPDCGPAMTAAFRRYRDGRYAGSDVPTMAERTLKEPFFFDPSEHRKLVDYYGCLAEETADCLISAAEAAKKALPGRLVGVYYGYVLAVHPPEGATVLVDKILSSGAVDFMANPAMYTAASRLAGGSYYPRAIPETFRRHGKLMLIEDDMRHYLIAPFTPGHRRITTSGPREAEMTTRRNMLNLWFDGCGIQFLDCNSRREERLYTHDAPEIFQAIHDVRTLATVLGPRPADSGNRTAVVIDWRQRFLRPSNVHREHNAVYVNSIEGCYASGVPVDLMTLDDFLALPEGRYSSAVFLNVFSAEGALKDALARRTAAKGFRSCWFLKSALGGKAAGRTVLRKLPSGGEEWRKLLTGLGAPAFAPAGHYVRRHGDRFMFHTGKAGRWTLTPAGCKGVHEVFSKRDYAGDSFEIVTDGPDTLLFVMKKETRK